MTKRIYNVILQSAIGDGTTTSNETFFYDWTQIPDVPYYVLPFFFCSLLCCSLLFLFPLRKYPL